MTRSATVERSTKETGLSVTVDLDGSGTTDVETGVPFFDHMLDQLGRHGRLDLTVKAKGDVEIDAHHTVEDTGIVLGQALAQALGDKRGVRRHGWSIVPMEEALVQVGLDLSGRPFLAYEVPVPDEQIGNYDPELTEEFFVALTRAAGITLHIRLLAGKNSHHVVEGVFKAVAKALQAACETDPRRAGEVPSTKGQI